MSIHKAFPEGTPQPTEPNAVVMANGRGAVPHAQVNDKPLLGGIQNATVEGVERSPEEEKSKVQEYHKGREAAKKAAQEAFDPKTGEPKRADIFKTDPVGDAKGTDVEGKVPTEETEKTLEAVKEEAPQEAPKKGDKK